jgi:hypothetical protein
MFNPFRKVRRSAKHAALRQRLGVSRLESREVPSTVALMDRELIIHGARGDDVIEVWGRFESEFVPETSKEAASAILPAPYALVLADGEEVGRFQFTAFDSIRIYGHAGNDRLAVSEAIPTLVYLDGADGNDTLVLEPAEPGTPGVANLVEPMPTAAVMVGGMGDDVLIGGSGNDVLIGGNGRDRLYGLGGEDLLIGGRTIVDGNAAPLFSILSAWNDGAPYLDRVEAVRTEMESMLSKRDPSFVYYDGSIDYLDGGEGMDWFFAAGNAKFAEMEKGEILDR